MPTAISTGTASSPEGSGIVFELSPAGGGNWTPIVIHTFAGGKKDGSDPGSGTLVFDSSGNLYGTTTAGGTKNVGTVYKLSYSKKKGWTEKILHSFKGGKKDGSQPLAGVVLDAAGNLYGNTQNGGEYGDGTVFELVAPVGGKGSYKEKILSSFNHVDGLAPYGSLILYSGNLYGTTSQGGPTGDAYGNVFEVAP